MKAAASPKPEPEAVVALVSGGADSCVMAAEALRTRRVYPLYVRQGALWEDAEEAAIRRFLAAIAPEDGRVAPLRTARLDLPDGYASQWALHPEAGAPGADSPDEAVYLPGRNLSLLLQGALLAQSLEAHTIMLGLLAGNPFPDSRPDFFQSFEQTYELATGYRVRVEAPLRGLHKGEVLRMGTGLPLELTLSCIRPADGRHCGRCNKCAERQRGFAEAGMKDPTAYEE